MKAWIRHVYGEPEVLKLVEVEKPIPKAEEVLVRVRATSLNASDWEILRGKPLYGRMFGFFTPKVKILGSDVAGTVEAVGAKVTRFVPGDSVYGDIFERWGGLGEWVSVPEGMLRSKRDAMTFAEAAAIPQSGVIAIQGLRDKGKVQPGQTVLINGAGGSSGTFAIQIAKAMGAEVTAVDNAQKQNLMRSLGADHVIDYAKEDFTQNGQRYDLILDLVGYHGFFEFRRSLTSKGRYLIVGGPTRLVLGVLLLGTVLSLFGGKKMEVLALKVNRGLDALEEYFGSGTVRPIIDKRYALHDAPEALRCLGEGRAKGKLVIVFGSEHA